MVQIRKPYDISTHEGVVFTGASMTQQHFKDECDINTILDLYTRTGELPVNAGEMWYADRYADVSYFTDYTTMRAAMAQADNDFLELPARVRERYHNSTSEFLDAIATDEGRRELQSLMTVDGFSPRPAEGRDFQEMDGVTAKAAGGLAQASLDVTVPSDTEN